ncbi:MAG TPA: hypothetical protein DF613_00740, partial [Lachnospiraceae bacterium]|nr:hypothetical protein [Lachnospiraceae bacterium]
MSAPRVLLPASKGAEGGPAASNLLSGTGKELQGGGAVNHTVESWGRYWLEHHDKPNVRPSTYEAHRYLMENHIIPRLGTVPLVELTEGKVAA